MEGCRKNPPKVLSVGCCDQPTLFHKVTIPAAIGDETTDPPLPGKYRNVLLVYETTGNAYLYSSDGIPTQISEMGEIDRLEKLIKEEEEARKEADDALDDAILDETDARITADEDIWTEIRTIEAASDVVDVVGTYADLEAYDTSKLHDNDLIKVLQDETHGDAITYYRWSTATEAFSYVGEQGPYYTQEQTDILLNDKQDTLIAGSNIQIAADGKTISATDTTYTAGANVSISAQNVISATDTTYTAGTGINIANNVISSTVTDTTTLYVGSSSNEYRFYYDAAKTEQVTYQEMTQLLENGDVRLVTGNGSAAYVNAYSIGTGESYIFSYDSGMYRSYRWFSSNTYASVTAHYLQDELTAGSNITINNRTISATDTTYTAGTGLSLTGTEFAVDTTVVAEKSDIPTKTSELTNDGSDGTSTYVEADDLATVATSGSYTDLTNTPTIPAAQVNSDWNASSGVAEILNKPTLATVATSGSYNDLTDTPTIPSPYTLPIASANTLGGIKVGQNLSIDANGVLDAQAGGSTYTAGNGISIDQNDEISIDTSVVAELSDLPTKTSELTNDGSDGTSTYVEASDLATVATSGSYADLSNTPTIPTVNDATLTITQNGTSAGTFTANSATNTTIALTDTTYSAFTGTDGQTAGSAGLVPAPATTDAGKFLKADGTWDTAGGAANNINSTDWNALWQ